MLTHLVAKAFGILQTGSIFLSSDNTFWRRHTGKGIINKPNVFLPELVMIAEGKWRQVLYQRREVMYELFRRCYSG